MMLFAEVSTDTQQFIGLGTIGIILLVLNQLMNLWSKRRELLAQQAKDGVLLRREEAALCREEDEHAIKGYETLLSRYNTRLVDMEAELKGVRKELETEVKEVRKELANCQAEHARSEERVKHLESKVADVAARNVELERKYNALKKKIPGIDSDTVLLPEDEDPKP